MKYKQQNTVRHNKKLLNITIKWLVNVGKRNIITIIRVISGLHRFSCSAVTNLLQFWRQIAQVSSNAFDII